MVEIKIQGKLENVKHNNVGALSREIVKNGESLTIDFSGLYLNSVGDITKVDLFYPSGEVSSIKRVSGNLVTTKDVYVKYRYDYTGYDVKSWWNEITDKNGQKITLRGSWPGYTIKCKFYTTSEKKVSSDALEGDIYLQINYDEFDNERDSFEIVDAQLTDSGSVSYIMKHIDGEKETLYSVESGDWDVEYSCFKKPVIANFSTDELENYNDWVWTTSRDFSNTEIDVIEESGERYVLIEIAREYVSQVRKLVICYTDCTFNNGGNDFVEKRVDITSDSEYDDSRGGIRYNIHNILDDESVYRVRCQIYSKSGKNVFTKEILVTGMEVPLAPIVVPFQEGVINTRDFTVTIRNEQLELSVGSLKDGWLPTRYETVSSVLSDISDSLKRGIPIKQVIGGISDKNAVLCDELQRKCSAFSAYWGKMQVTLGDGNSNVYWFDDGNFELYQKIDGEYVSIYDVEITAPDELKHPDDYLLEYENLVMVYEVSKTYLTNQFNAGDLYTLNVMINDVCDVETHTIMSQNISFEYPLREDTAFFTLAENNQRGKDFIVYLVLDNVFVEIGDLNKVSMLLDDGSVLNKDANECREVTDVAEQLGIYISQEDGIYHVYEYRFSGNFIKDFVGGNVTMVAIAGKDNKIEKTISGVSFEYMRPVFKNVSYGGYNTLVNGVYKLNAYVCWDVENDGGFSPTTFKLLLGNNVYFTSLVQPYNIKDGVANFFINVPIDDNTESFIIDISVHDGYDVYERDVRNVVDSVRFDDDYIVSHGYHPSFEGEELLPSLKNLNAFAYAWDMTQKFNVLDTFRDNGMDMYHEILTRANGGQTLVKRRYDYIKMNTLAPFCMGYKVKRNGSDKVQVGGLLCDVYHQLGKLKVDGYNNNTYHKKRVFVDDYTGKTFERYDAVPIMKTSTFVDGDFIPVLNEGQLEYEEIKKTALYEDDGEKIILKDNGDIDEQTFEKTFDGITFIFRRRGEQKTFDLVCVSETQIEGSLFVIHDFNSFRSVRNFGSTIEKKTHEGRTLFVGRLTMNYTGETEHNAIVAFINGENKTTFLSWKVGQDVLSFNSSELEY